MDRIAVLGGGGTGCCMAAAAALRGFDVILYEEKKYWRENIDGIVERGGIEVTGNDLTGFARLFKITDSLEEAIGDVKLILVSMVAWRHQKLANALKPLLQEGQVVVFSAGNFGSIRLKNTLEPKFPIVAGEMMGNIFPCRMVGKGKAVIAFPYAPKKVAAFPAKDTNKMMEELSPVFKCGAAKNVFETALNAPNVVIHLAGSILNTAAIERNPDFSLYADGLSTGVISCQMAVEREKSKIMDKMGYADFNHTDLMKKLVQYDKFPELDLFRSLKGPSSMTHRYIKEDAAIGQSIMINLAELLRIDVPVMKALIKIASAINGVDYRLTGLKLADLGMDGLTTPEQINQFLHLGIT